MNSVSAIIRSFASLHSHCEAQLRKYPILTQLGIAVSPKQSSCSKFEVKRFSDSFIKSSCQLVGEGRLLRRSFLANVVTTSSSVESFQDAPRNDEGSGVVSGNVVGRVKGNLLEGSLL